MEERFSKLNFLPSEAYATGTEFTKLEESKSPAFLETDEDKELYKLMLRQKGIRL